MKERMKLGKSLGWRLAGFGRKWYLPGTATLERFLIKAEDRQIRNEARTDNLRNSLRMKLDDATNRGQNRKLREEGTVRVTDDDFGEISMIGFDR